MPKRCTVTTGGATISAVMKTTSGTLTITTQSSGGLQPIPPSQMAATTTAALGDGSTTGAITLDVNGAISIGAAVLSTGAVTVTLQSVVGRTVGDRQIDLIHFISNRVSNKG